jgi:hypothetical protein
MSGTTIWSAPVAPPSTLLAPFPEAVAVDAVLVAAVVDAVLVVATDVFKALVPVVVPALCGEHAIELGALRPG